MRFSEKYKYVQPKAIQIESMDEILRNRLINVIKRYLTGEYAKQEMKYIIDKFGIKIRPDVYVPIQFDTLLDDTKVHWYMIYDIIDYCLLFGHEYPNWDDGRKFLICTINKTLEEEKAGYRIVNDEVAPITNPTEIAAIEETVSAEYNPVNIHISKALDLYSDRQSPDYENSIKESISAVESMCCIITGLSGRQATLGNALKKLKEHGVNIHPAMEEAFNKLYGYTSDENGIRHGGIDFTNAPAEDAKFMLVSCSAFVNYLIEKYAKIKGE